MLPMENLLFDDCAVIVYMIAVIIDEFVGIVFPDCRFVEIWEKKGVFVVKI